MKIHATHLYNDYSGSPKVLMQIVKSWIKEGHEVHLYLGSDQDGFLSELENVNYHYVGYRYSQFKFKRLIYFLWSQLRLFFAILRRTTKSDVVYVNTLLPFGSALAGKLVRAKVIYHIHETSIQPEMLRRFLLRVAQKTSTKIIYVSHFLKENLKLNHPNSIVIHNALEDDFYDRARKNRGSNSQLENILMVCSLKEYKGVNIFVKLSQANPNLNFKLVLNANLDEIDSYFDDHQLIVPPNLEVIDRQVDVHPFYNWSDLVMNLSLEDQWIETFGLTMIESMAYGSPVIAPSIGGITEVVENGRSGFLVDSRDFNLLQRKLDRLTTDASFYKKMVQESMRRAESFSESVFLSSCAKAIR